MVYIINAEGKPLMPTERHGKVKWLLKEGKAKVVRAKPFTIQLCYASSEYVQPVTLGIDSGYQNIGFSAVAEKREILCGEVKLLSGMSDRLKEKAMYRRIRRQRLRHRKARFDNRKKEEGWLAPTIQHKIDSHVRLIEKIKSVIPVSETTIEVANFDIQKIKNPEIEGEQYQKGEQLGFWNVREYVLHRDSHTCQNPNCKNKDKEQILQIHHIVYQENGGTDVPSNLITLCNKCHTTENHKKGKFLYEWQENKPKLRSFKDATFMSMMRWMLINQLECNHTYGYITKHNRIKYKIEKSHCNDAYVIAGGTTEKRTTPIMFEQVRRNNRSLEKFYDAKYIDIRTEEKVSGTELNSGRRVRNKNKNSENLRAYRGAKVSKGQRRIRTERYLYQPNDLVKYEGKVYTVRGTQNGGSYVALRETKKVPRVEVITPYRFRKGFAC
jgi:hypothetical protein